MKTIVFKLNLYWMEAREDTVLGVEINTVVKFPRERFLKREFCRQGMESLRLEFHMCFYLIASYSYAILNGYCIGIHSWPLRISVGHYSRCKALGKAPDLTSAYFISKR